MKFVLHQNGRSRQEEESRAVDRNNPHKNRVARQFIVFARLLKKAAERKIRSGAENGKNTMVRFQDEFARLVRRFGEAEALRKIQSKIKIPRGRIKNSLGRFRFWLGSSLRNKVLVPVIGCSIV